MPMFKKLPVEVEAILWDGTNTDEVRTFIGDIPTTGYEFFTFEDMIARIPTPPEGQERPPLPTKPDNAPDATISVLNLPPMALFIGDWIIKGVAGEVYPCRPEAFAQTYEAV